MPRGIVKSSVGIAQCIVLLTLTFCISLKAIQDYQPGTNVHNSSSGGGGGAHMSNLIRQSPITDTAKLYSHT